MKPKIDSMDPSEGDEPSTDPDSPDKVPELSDVGSGDATLLLIRAGVRDGAEEAVRVEEERLNLYTPEISRCFIHCLDAFLKQLELSPGNVEKAKNFVEGKERLQLRFPREDWQGVFTSLGRRESRSANYGNPSTEFFQALTDHLRNGLNVQIPENDTALVRARLAQPYRAPLNFELTVTVTEGEVFLELGLTPPPDPSPTEGLSVEVDKDRYRFNFNEDSLDFKKLKNLDKSKIEGLLLKLDWLQARLDDLSRANAWQTVSLEISGLIPTWLTAKITRLKTKKGREVFEEARMLKDELTAWKQSLKYVQSVETRTLETKERPLQDVFCPGLTLACLETYGFDYERTLEKDGFKFFLLPVTKVGDYFKCLFYVYDGQRLVPRLAYYSQSHQRWRIDSAYRLNVKEPFAFIKGLYSYTGETIPCLELEYLLLDLQATAITKVEEPEEGSEDEEGQTPGYHVNSLDPYVNTYKDEMSEGFIPGLHGDFARCETLERMPNRKKPETLLKAAFPKDFLPDFSAEPLSVRKALATDFFPQGYMLEEYQFTYKETNLRIVMAYDPKGQVWVNRIEPLDTPINSYGIASNFVGFGPLQWKPFELSDQIAEEYLPFVDKPEGRARVLQYYCNITRLFDFLPLVKEFRKKRKIKRLAA